jgi:hypothetical protein
MRNHAIQTFPFMFRSNSSWMNKDVGFTMDGVCTGAGILGNFLFLEY